MNAHRALLAGSLLSAALASAVPATALAARELVSRATGADGAPIPDARLTTATRDGRFVLFSGPASVADTAATAGRTTYFLRDRESDTTTPVLRADGANGAILSNSESSYSHWWAGIDLSADGTKVLFSGPRQEGGTRTALYVRDLAAGTTTIVSWLPSGDEAFKLAGQARFINGGAGIIFGAADTDGALATYTRDLASGTTKLFQAGVAPASATADGQTITWSRPLAPAKRPADSRIGTDSSWVAAYGGTAIGFTTKGQPPVVVSRTTHKEVVGAPASYCYDGGITTERTLPSLLTVNDTGTLLHKEYAVGGVSYDNTSVYAERTADGPWISSNSNTFPRVNLSVFDLGETGQTWLWGRRPFASGYIAPLLGIGGTAANLPDLTSPVPDPGGHNRGFNAARLFAGDTGFVTGEVQGLHDPLTGVRTAENAVYAYDPIADPRAVIPTTPGRIEGEILDDPALTADVTWANCPDDPIGTASDYVTATFNTPFTSSKPAGTVTTKQQPVARDGNIRPSTKTTVTVKTFGITTWSKTLQSSLGWRPHSTVTLPNPWRWFPQTVTIDTEIAGYYGTPAKHVVQTRSWMAWK